MNEIITQKGFNYSFNPSACFQCKGNCCIGESGYIWINNQEINYLSKFLKLSVEEVKKKYLNKINTTFSIKEVKLSYNNYSCIFFNTEIKRCSIYDARPKQCKTFPFWDYFKENEKEVYKECPAIKTIV